MKYFKVGGMRFLRIGKLQVSWCVCTGKPKVRKPKRLSYIAAYRHGYYDGRFHTELEQTVN